jgi:hypothetical protein
MRAQFYIRALKLPPIRGPLAAFPIFNLDASSSVIYNLYGLDTNHDSYKEIDFTRERSLTLYRYHPGPNPVLSCSTLENKTRYIIARNMSSTLYKVI